MHGFGGRAAILLYLKLFDTARKVDARFPSASSDDRVNLAEQEWDRLQATLSNCVCPAPKQRDHCSRESESDYGLKLLFGYRRHSTT